MLFTGCNIFSQVMVVFLKIILRFKYVPLAFDIYHLIFGDKSLRVLYLHIWNQVIKALKAELSSQVSKMLMSDWFGPKCNYKFSSYLNELKKCLS